MRYRGVKIKVIEVDYNNFDNISFKYGRTLIIYVNKGLSSQKKSRLLHKVIRETRLKA